MKSFKNINNVSNLISVSEVSKFLGISPSTINLKIRTKKIPSFSDGYRHYISSQTFEELKILHKSALDGWVLKVDIAKKYNVRKTLVDHIIISLSLERAKDLVGKVRLSQASVNILDSILPLYVSKNTFYKNGTTYYSIVFLAETMAKNLSNKSCERFKKHQERICKMLYSWCSSGHIEFIRIPGMVHLYVPEKTYHYLRPLVRITDCSLLVGRSRRTIYNWIDKGVLKTTTPVIDRMVSIHDLDRAIVFKTQLDLIRNNNTNPEKLDSINNFSSIFWRLYLENISQSEDLYLKRAVKAIRKIRGISYATFSGDSSVRSDGEKGSTYWDRMEDQAANRESPENIEMLYSAMDFLSELDRKIIMSFYGLDGVVKPLNEMASLYGISVEEFTNRVDNSLETLRKTMDDE